MKHPAVNHPFQSLMAAIRFLTILPLPGSGEDDVSFFEGALFFFTITGLIIGLIGASLAYLLVHVFPTPVVAVLLALFLSLISGFFHLDGLADSSDGLLSARPAPQCLEIMKDSRIGVMGAAALCSVFLLKAASLAALDDRSVYYAMIIAPPAGRTAIVLMMAILPYARDDRGLGKIFYSDVRGQAAFFSVLVLITATIALVASKLILLSVAVVLTVVLFSLICRRKIGGATGDTLGALCELTETAVIMSFCLVI